MGFCLVTLTCVYVRLDVQGVLLGDLLVLLQKQDDKMLLKCQSKSVGAPQEGKQMLSPIIKLDSAFLRDVATGKCVCMHASLHVSQVGRWDCCINTFFSLSTFSDNKAFYVIFAWESGAQIYELVAQSVAERKTWVC